MNKPWKVIFAFLGVFLAGAVFGGFLSVRMARNHVYRSSSMDRFTPMILNRYADRLELSPEQLDKIKPIVKSADEALRHLRSIGYRDAVAVGEKMNEEVSKLLTPEQNAKLEELKQEMRARWKKDRGKRGDEPLPSSRVGPNNPRQ